MYNGVESDGELFKMRQEAVQKAREMSRNATLPNPECSPCKDIKKFEEKSSGISGKLSSLFKRFDKEDLLLLAILILLMTDDADDEIIIMVLFAFICGIF